MKKLLLVALSAAAVAVPAFAGECSGGGFSCANECPLAQKANTHRSTGREAMTASTALRATLAAQVERNLARV
jgi:hypothetical protein